ncbi:MAG: 3-isopropylmalate dehydratase [Promethearchaeota archaeon]|nr:MAG: 3-isopropylmalate dehydratase [Candidatus Lokiarchaeota archaeon]
MKDKLEGYAYVLGDDINTDDIVPSHTLTMRDSDKMAQHTLQYVDPNFIKSVKKENIIIAGENFGTGSSREEAVHVFKILGIQIIIAKSFARIYYRNLINSGIPGIQLDWKDDEFSPGDQLEVSLKGGYIINHSKNMRKEFKKLPQFLMNILDAGGILNQIRKDLKDS